MFTIFITFLLFHKSFAQIDGQFWWLNPKLDKFREPPPQPKFEDLSDFDTDQSAKIVFRNDDWVSKEEKFGDLKLGREKNLNGDGKLNQAITFQDKSEITRPKETVVVTQTSEKKKNYKNVSQLPADDIFLIKFPDDILMASEKPRNFTNKIKSVSNKINDSNDENIGGGKITYLTNVVNVKLNKNVAPESENICSYIKKSECNRIGGVVYVKHKSDWKQNPFETKLICCILPIRSELESSKIYFVDNSNPKRCKRSEKEVNSSLKQRDALLLRRFGPQGNRKRLTTPSPTKIPQRVVTPSDDYGDPYWNIKNIKKPNHKHQLTTKYEYDSNDYVEDYTVELPKPGLTGLYSDHGPSNPGWGFPTTRPNYGAVDSEEIIDEAAFGYSPTVDPRLVDRIGHSAVNGRPVKLSTLSDERNYDAESQTISYHSDPDFQVLQGFKLLNLVRNRNRVHRKGKKTTTERLFDTESKEHVFTASLESYDHDSSENDLVYKGCGRVAKDVDRRFEKGDEIGETAKGSHPSLVLVTLTKMKQSFVCYGAIIHPRAVITAASCVLGRTDPGEITVIAGAWQLDEESNEEWQKRMATVYINPDYQSGDVADNLALLYWTRPLRLNSYVQPACLSAPHVGDECQFFGWGGYDQALRKQSRRQRALVLSERTCKERVTNKRTPSQAFCAAVQSRASVTGIGGPLLCNHSGRQSVVGVAVWRDLAVLLLPAQEWVAQTIQLLNLD